MEIIREGNKLILGLISNKQHIEEVTSSSFNAITENGKKYVLFNTLSRAIVCLDKDEYHIFAENDYHSDSAKELMNTLFQKGFLVPSGINELKRYKDVLNVYRIIWKNANNKIKQYKIFTTTHCNARCFYCFEEGMSYKHMTLKTAEDIVNYILKTCSNEKITLYWFGGEPLCNVNAIDYICNRLCEHKIDYTSKIITNGFLFDEALVQKSVDLWKLHFAQITLDGTEEVHNRRKAYVKVSGSPFKRTISNIKSLLDADVFVTVRLNFDEDNIKEIYELIDILAIEFKKYERFSVYPAILSNNWLNHKEERSSKTEEVLGNELFNIYRTLLKYNLYNLGKISNTPKPYFCMAANPACATISVDGELYTCQSCDTNMKFGTVTNGVANFELLNEWENCLETPNKCLQCPHLPSCSTFNKCPTQSYICKEEKDLLIAEQIKLLLRSSERADTDIVFDNDLE